MIDPLAAKALQLKGNARIMINMSEGRRVFTEATQGSICGCKKLESTAHVRESCGERAIWTPERAAG